MADATYTFLSYVRTGFAAAITTADTFSEAQPALAVADVGVTVAGSGGAPTPVSHAATVRGPGDVVGLARSQVVRTDPVDGSIGVEPNYFAQVEFDRPDLPWMFTPAAAVGERLRPWLALVVLDASGPNACTLAAGAPLPTLTVPAAAADQLPDLVSSYLWAHAQVVAPEGQSLTAALSGPDPRLNVSRLLCPRHLSANTPYLAAVVPTFEVGRLAGLGMPVQDGDEATLAPAWTVGGNAVLPVLYSFRFTTGDDADFESLARKLAGRPLPAGVGTRAMDVSRPGAGIPELPQPTSVDDTHTITWLGGALQPIDVDTAAPRQDPAAQEAFRTSLTILLDRPAELVRGGVTDAVVAPPIYGDQHALVVELGSGTPPPWLAELNLDTRARVAAGLGTQVIQQDQEDLMARAWQQLGDVLSANHALRRAQFARTASLRVHQRLSTLDPANLLALSAPGHARVIGASGAPVTLTSAVRTSRLPRAAATSAFRRLVRPVAATARAAAKSDVSAAVINRFSTAEFTTAGGLPDGVATMLSATEVIGETAAAATLTTLGDTSGGGASRLDTTLATLAGALTPLPTGDDIRAGTVSDQVGAVALLKSMGAVSASAIGDTLRSAVQPSPPSSPGQPAPPPIRVPRSPGPIVGPGTPMRVQIIPTALTHPTLQPRPPRPQGPSPGRAVRTDLSAGRIFTPPGGDVVLDPGRVVVHGGAVVITDDAVTKIVTGQSAVSPVSDATWAQLARDGKLPISVAAADPVSDPGTRLDTFRKDPVALTALAQLAGGQVQATVELDRAAAGLAVTGTALGALEALATGTFEAVLPVVKPSAVSAADRTSLVSLLTASADAFDRLVTAGDAPIAPAGPSLDLVALRVALLAKIDPEVTVLARIHSRISRPAVIGIAPRDPLDQVMACPQFRDPMWQSLRDLTDQGSTNGNDWMLPGLGLVPPDTATLVKTNPAFVVAHLVGLNHEFMRELLWREYPTDRRGTSFARFWGRPGPSGEDIIPTHTFTGGLVDNLTTGENGEAVLLLRSELLRRYPGSIVYLSQATEQNTPSGARLVLNEGSTRLPVFRGDLPPDVTFVGFPIQPEELRTGSPPWWFVLAQPPTEPRFGLDDPADDTPALPTSANDLAWSHLSPDGSPASPTSFAIADPPTLRGHRIEGLTWGANAAVQAHLTYQHPVRVAIRAADMLPPSPAPGPPAPAPAEGGTP